MRSVRISALLVAGAALSLPAAAQAADVLSTYSDLAQENLSAAPLVPTTVPSVFEPIGRSLERGTTIGGRGYGIRLAETSPSAVIALSGGEFRSMRAVLREARRRSLRVRSTRVRGHRGRLLTKTGSRELAWVEGGVVYWIGSGTPRTISLRALRRTAAALERLEGAYLGGADDPDDSSEAHVVVTERTVTANVSFEADCRAPGQTEPTVRVGRAEVTLLPRSGGGFTIDVARYRRGTQPFEGTITGSVSTSTVTLDVRATGNISGQSCDTGQLRLTLPRLR